MSLRNKRKLGTSTDDEPPDGWIVRKSASRDRNFYFNEKTGVSTWTKPQKTVSDDGASSIIAHCSKTGGTQMTKRPQGISPNPLPLPESSNKEKSRNKSEKTFGLPTIEDVVKKVSFSLKQRPSLQKPSDVFTNNPASSKSPNKSCHDTISGKVTKGCKNGRQAKPLGAKITVSSIHLKEIKTAMQSSYPAKKKSHDTIHSNTQSPISCKSVNEKHYKSVTSKSQVPSRRYSYPDSKSVNAHSSTATSSRVKLTQDELVRRYDKTHPCKVIKPEKEDFLFGKRSKDERVPSTNPLKDWEVIDMEWEDIENEKVLLNIHEHRQQFQEMKYEDFTSPPVDMEVQYFDYSNNKSKDFVIVLDTNVLISDVKFVGRLIEKEFQGIEHPTLVIPWMVLKELDALKGKPPYKNTALERNARRAIQFIHQCFNSHNPWIKGQSALDDREECFKVDGPDDSILNCCLQLQHRRKKVILLSNDINLCNKALANGVKSFEKDQLEKKIQDEDLELLFIGEPGPGKEIYSHQRATAGKSPPSVAKNQGEKPKNEVLLSKFKSLLHQFLSKLLETEMKSVYEGMWLKIVYLKPPWSLLDLLHCFSKHWCAVFCFILDKPAKNKVEELIIFFRKSFSGYSIKNIEDAINSAIILCSANTSKKYSDLASEYKNHFQALLKEDHKVEAVMTESQDLAPSSSLPSSERSYHDIDADVVYAFQSALTLVITFCGIVYDVLGISHEIVYDKPERLPFFEELKEKVPIVNKCLEDLIFSMRSVLEVQECYLTVQHPAVMGLFTSILAMIPADNQVVGAISCERLLSFAVGAKSRVMLANGLNQFVHYQFILARVINGDINR